MTGFDPLQPFASGSNREVPFVDKASSPEQNPAQEGRRLPLKGFASATQPASRAVGGPVNLPVRQVAAVVMGNALEFYDFGTYSYFALQIGRTFFPTQNPLSSLLLSFATFGVGFLTRPVGAVVVGRLADRTGRRPAMVLTFLLMGIAICGIALTHSYRSIGLAAPIMVLGWRLLQGFALGGEMGPTAAFLVEAAPPARRGFYGSLQFSAQAFSGFAAGLVGFGLSSVLDAQSLDNWGWRGAFMIGATVVPVGLVIRRSSPETLHAPDSRSSLEPGAGRSYIVVGVLGLILVSSITISAYVYGYLTTYVQSTLRMSSHVAFAMTMISGLASTCVLPIGGWYSDKIGRKPVMITFTLLLAACTLPAFLAIIHFRTPGALYAATALLNVFRAIGFAPMLTAITESLPRRVRAGVFGTLYALAVMLLGGSTQFVVAWLTGVSGNPLVPAWFITGAAILGLSAMIALRESAPAVVERVRRRITVPT